MNSPSIHFPSESYANELVAGVPCAARLARHWVDTRGLTNTGTFTFVIEGGGQLSRFCQAELARLTPHLDWRIAESSGDKAIIRADETLTAIARSAGHKKTATLAETSRAIIAATGKPTDGFISRFMNRPMSKAISRQLLRNAYLRPIHATLLCALIGLAMAVCLFAGGYAGLLPAAILFQIASIIDGVDGEMARATWRSSKSGATLDTASDAAINFAFIGGLSFNLWQQGFANAALAGLIGAGLLVLGLGWLGWLSLRAGKGLSFDAIKSDIHTGRSPLLLVLAKLTSRDFYVLALALMVACGLAEAALYLFAIGVIGWFGFLVSKLTLR